MLIKSPSRLLLMPFWTMLLLAFAMSSRSQPSAKFIPEPADLQSCVGRYQASPDTIVTVRCDGGRLNLTVNSGSPLELIPKAKDRFVNEQNGTRIHFARDTEGKVTDLVLERDGEHRAKRIGDISGTSGLSASENVRNTEVDGTPFRVAMSGDGKTPVVFVSGIANWIKVADGIRGEACVVRYENNGIHSESWVPPDVQTQIKLLHDLLATLEVPQPFMLVGWSYDGALTRLYADTYPDEVGGLVLVDPFDEGFVDWLKENAPQNYRLFRQRAAERYVSEWDDFIRRLRKARVPKSIPVVLLTAGHRQIREGDALENQISSADFEKGAMAVNIAHEAWISKIPNGRLVVVPNAGHDIPAEHPDYVIKAIQQELMEKAKDGK